MGSGRNGSERVQGLKKGVLFGRLANSQTDSLASCLSSAFLQAGRSSRTPGLNPPSPASSSTFPLHTPHSLSPKARHSNGRTLFLLREERKADDCTSFLTGRLQATWAGGDVPT